MHVPPTHRAGDVHSGLVPHWHWPVAEQLLDRCMEHVVQKLPLNPHCDVVGGETQFAPEQQPSGQLVPLHLHTPPTHSWPAWHSAWPPHVQAPIAEQPSAV
jgi:hypothetical protein